MFNPILRASCALVTALVALAGCSSADRPVQAGAPTPTVTNENPPTAAPAATPRPTPAPAVTATPAPTPTSTPLSDPELTLRSTGDADPADATVTISVQVVDGSVLGGAQSRQVDTGSVVLIEVALGEVGEVHLHGYDFSIEGDGGETVQIAFVANIAGVWEVELEGPGIRLVELEVS